MKGFRPRVEESDGLKLRWVEVKTIVQEPVVNSQGACFEGRNLRYKRRRVCLNIKLGVVSVLTERNQIVTGLTCDNEGESCSAGNECRSDLILDKDALDF